MFVCVVQQSVSGISIAVASFKHGSTKCHFQYVTGLFWFLLLPVILFTGCGLFSLLLSGGVTIIIMFMVECHFTVTREKEHFFLLVFTISLKKRIRSVGYLCGIQYKYPGSNDRDIGLDNSLSTICCCCCCCCCCVFYLKFLPRHSISLCVLLFSVSSSYDLRIHLLLVASCSRKKAKQTEKK